MVKPELFIQNERDFDTAGEGMSGWLTGTNGAFRLPYRADYKFGTGDYTIVQTFDALANSATRIATYDDYTTNDGVRLSQTSDTFTVESGPVTVTLPANPLDGTNQWFMAERESGVAVRAYLNDFDTAVATSVGAAADISNTEPLDLAYDGTTRMDGLLGITIVFTRLLEEWEKDDLYYWIESGYYAEFEPDWVRAAAVLLVNPTDPVQRSEYGINETIVNLAVTPPSDTLYVRYNLTSTDGIANPELSAVDIKLAEPSYYGLEAGFGYDSGPTPALQLGHGEQPLVVSTGDASYSNVAVPIDVLPSTWLNDDWTLNFWAKFRQDGLDKDVVYHTDINNFSIRHTNLSDLRLYIGGINVLTSTVPSPAHSKFSMITVRRSGNNFEMFFDAISNTSATNSVTHTPTSNLEYNPSPQGVIGPLEIYHRALSNGEIAALFNSAPEPNISLGGATITITSGFATQSLNWERI